ncbi:MAG: lipolytic enzyme, G-D-S-L [Sphingomonadales bacterium]|nr:lipolytic enzyme, G-D-S-L [Sphingomonadales bacterium]
MRRIFTIMIAGAFLSGSVIPALAQSVAPADIKEIQTKGVKPLPVRAVGRVSETALPAPMPKGAVSYVHQWPAVYFEAAFTGDNVLLKFDDPLNEYRLFVDGGKPITIAQPGSGVFKVGGLSRQPHKLRLEKVTESINGVGAFQGFYINKGAKAGRSTPRKRQIEFIGDSGMAGYGVRSTKRECTKEEVRLLSDTQIAYPALTAKHFNADYQVNAYSGRGIIRNYDGAEPGVTMPALYPFTLYDKSVSYADPKWQPQIILVGLGGNDISTPLKKDEKWQSTEQFAQDFMQSYAQFLGQLHVRSPGAALVILWPISGDISDPEAAKYARLAQDTLTAEAKRIGFRDFTLLTLKDLTLDTSACDYHASIEDYQKLTVWMTKFLESKPELWGE